MDALTKFYLALFLWMPLSPILILAVAVVVTLRMRRWKWIVHILAVVAMLLSMPLYLIGGGILDPTTIEYPGPGDGIAVLLWLVFLVGSMLGYAIYVFVPWKGVKAVNSSR